MNLNSSGVDSADVYWALANASVGFLCGIPNFYNVKLDLT